MSYPYEQDRARPGMEIDPYRRDDYRQAGGGRRDMHSIDRRDHDQEQRSYPRRSDRGADFGPSRHADRGYRDPQVPSYRDPPYAEPNYYGPGTSAYSGYDEDFPDGHVRGQDRRGGYGVGHSMQGLARYDQEYDSPRRGAYGMGGYGRNSDLRTGRYEQRHADTGYAWSRPASGLQGRFGTEEEPYESGTVGGYGDLGVSRYLSGQGQDDRRYGRGYSVDDQRGYRGLGPRGYKRSDERLAEDINERLTDDDHIDASGISVAVKDGVVTLGGEVRERRTKHHIEDLVERCHGLQDIRNQITVRRRSGTVDDARDDESPSGHHGTAGQERASESNGGTGGSRKK